MIVFVWPTPTRTFPSTAGDDATIRSPRRITSASAGPRPERERRISTSVPSNGTATVTVPTGPWRVTTATLRVTANFGGLPTLNPPVAVTETLLDICSRW